MTDEQWGGRCFGCGFRIGDCRCPVDSPLLPDTLQVTGSKVERGLA